MKKTPLAKLIKMIDDYVLEHDNLTYRQLVSASFIQEKAKRLLEEEKIMLVDFHVSVMEKGLEEEASERKRGQWEKIVRETAIQYFKEAYNQ